MTDDFDELQEKDVFEYLPAQGDIYFHILGQGGSQHLHYPKESFSDLYGKRQVQGKQTHFTEFHFTELSAAENQVLNLRYCKKYSYAKIAQVMRRSKNAVNQLAYRAREKIRCFYP